jgi:ubiquinone/menaquinone biosynthesis C-methylase UbiE
LADNLKILDLGCGRRKRPNAVGIDSNPRSDADVIHDLNLFPYPFPENEFDEVYADNILEHLDDILKVMAELHRITKSSGNIHITVPHYSHRNAHTDPTHKHFFGVHSFDYFIDGTSHSDFRYSSARFTLISVEFDHGIEHRHMIDSFITSFANSYKDIYENRFSNIFPLSQLTFILKVLK